VRRLLVAALAVACLVPACASGDTLDPTVAQDLGKRVASIRTMAETGQRYKAKQALQSLIGSVQALEAEGTVGEDRAGQILQAANDVLADLALLPVPTTTESSSPSAELSVPDASNGSDEHPDHGGENGNGHGNGNGKDNGKKVGHDKD
jgi:hypothetical protein